MKRTLQVVALLAASAAVPAWGQIWDQTGNSQMSGDFYFRDMIYQAQAGGNVFRAVMATGTLRFSGNGAYTGTVNVLDSFNGTSQFSASGAYSISASGHGFMTHPVTGGTLHGVLSSGVFLGSSTESLVNDLIVMIPAASPTNSTFTGSYSLAYLSVTGGLNTNTYDSLATLNPNGSGNVGTVPVRTYVGNQPDVRTTNETGVTYSFNSGVGTLRFPTTQQLPIQGDKVFFISGDGNFILGGSISGFDMFVGVRRHSGTAPAMDGLYYSAGIDHIPLSFDTFYGSFKAVNGTLYEHQRYLSTTSVNPVDYTATGFYPATPINDYTDDLTQAEYVVGRDANFRIGIGKSPYMTLRVAVRAPVFTPPNSNPFIDPTGVVNSATFAPFTAGIAHGELVAIFGKNLSTVTQSAVGGQPFPKIMGTVQVKMNGRDCAIYFVSPDVISAAVPYGISDAIIQIQVIRNGIASNAVTAFRHPTAPGIFTQDQSGTGFGAIRDLNFATINDSNHTQPGALIQAYLTGLGDVFPVIDDGAISPGGSGEPLAKVVGNTAVLVDNLLVTPDFAGLTPTVATLYQLNFKVPDDSSSGNVFVDILTADAHTSQAVLPVGVSASSALRKAAETRAIPRRR